MDKSIILNKLKSTFLTEETTPAIKLAKDIKEKNGKINKAATKEVGKDMKAYDASSKKPDKDAKNMPTNKINYNSEEEKDYHNQMEIMNGQEMIQYDRQPNKEYKDRAIEAIEGSSRMGNNPEWANVVAKGQGGDPEFGKNLVKTIKASEKKRSEATPTTKMYGDDWEVVKEKSHKPYAFESEENKKTIIKENKTIMKRAVFKKQFNGFGNAIKVIPEAYKVDKNVFEITDGFESYTMRWEGPLNEGKAIILKASDSKLINEDIQRMKALFNYKSESTLGLVKGKDRIDENAIFNDIYNKTKKLLSEQEDIDDVTAPVETDDDAGINQAADAKKHIDGSVPQKDLGGEAPKPKVGEWEKISVPQAADAKKHVEGSVAQKDLGGEAPKPKNGEWEEINISQPAEAKKHIQENEDDENNTDRDTSSADNYYKADTEDTSTTDVEPTATDIKTVTPPVQDTSDDDDIKVPTTKVGLFSVKNENSPNFGKTYVMIKGSNSPHEVPADLMSLAKSDPAAALEEILAREGGVETGDEY